jgi:hypothetical protein
LYTDQELNKEILIMSYKVKDFECPNCAHDEPDYLTDGSPVICVVCSEKMVALLSAPNFKVKGGADGSNIKFTTKDGVKCEIGPVRQYSHAKGLGDKIE